MIEPCCRKRARELSLCRRGGLFPLALVTALLLGLASGCGPRSSGKGRKKPQTVPLTVTSSQPADGSADIAADTVIEVEFSRVVQTTTITPDSYRVSGSVGGVANGAFAFPAGGLKVAFTPSVPFQHGEEVEVALTSAVISADDVPLTPKTIRFTVAEAPPPPPPPPPVEEIKVVSVSPQRFSSATSRVAAVTLTFDTPLDPVSVEERAIGVVGSQSGRVPLDAPALGAGNTTLSVTPLRLYLPGETITIEASSSLRGVAGEVFAGWNGTFRVVATAPPRERTQDKTFMALSPVSSLHAADLNLDGIPDLIHTMENEAVVDILVADANGTLTPALRIDVGAVVQSLAVIDVDADGDSDILVGAADRAALFINDRAPSSLDRLDLPFTPGPLAPVGTSVIAVQAADLDHNGSIDFVLGTATQVLVLLDGLAAAPAATIAPRSLPAGGVVLGDLDLDGLLDLIHGDEGEAGMPKVVFRAGTGAREAPFADPVSIEIASLPVEMSVEDVTGDGAPELLVLTLDGASLGAPAFRVVHRTSGGFVVEQPAGPSLIVEAREGEGATLDTGRFLLADLDGDGWVELILTSSLAGGAFVYPGSEAGVDLYATPTSLLALPDALALEALDVTGDGSLEVALGGRNEVHLLLPALAPPEPGQHKVWVEDAQLRQGDVDARAIVRLTTSSVIQGYSVALGYPSQAVLPREADIAGTATGDAAPDFANFSLRAEESALVYSVIFNLLPAPEPKVIPVGQDLILLRIAFDVLPDAPLGDAAWTFPESVGTPPVGTTLVSAGLSVIPETAPGALSILPPKEPPPPPTGNEMRVSEAQTAAGASVAVDVLGSLLQDADAFTTILGFDPTALEVLSLDLSGTATELLAPELVIPVLDNLNGTATLTVIFDFLPPFERQTLAPARDALLLRALIRAKPGAAPGAYTLGLINEVGSPPLNNIYVFGGESVFPELVPGLLLVTGASAPTFVRGDSDGSGSVELADGVRLVAYLFQGGSEPECLDAADVDDSGVVQLTDAVYLLDHLFRGGSPPPAPYPGPGLDPTADGLGCRG